VDEPRLDNAELYKLVFIVAQTSPRPSNQASIAMSVMWRLLKKENVDDRRCKQRRSLRSGLFHQPCRVHEKEGKEEEEK
jgi:hypothetical protein